MTPVAPARIASLASERWAGEGEVSRSVPQWKVAITTSARRTSRLTLAGLAKTVPGRPGPAPKPAGLTSEKPTRRCADRDASSRAAGVPR